MIRNTLNMRFVGIISHNLKQFYICPRYTRACHYFCNRDIVSDLPMFDPPVGRFFGLDIGGTMTKLVVLCPSEASDTVNSPNSNSELPNCAHWSSAKSENALESYNDRDPGSSPTADLIERVIRRLPQHPGYEPELELSTREGKYSFLRFETKWMSDFVNVVKEVNDTGHRFTPIGATGGGSYKFAELLKSELHMDLLPCDEMKAIVQGFQFFTQNDATQCYWYDLEEPEPFGKKLWTDSLSSATSNLEDALVVNIGSGISVLKVTHTDVDGAPANAFTPCTKTIERVNGSSIGGATFWGLCRLLTTYSSFQEAIDDAVNGNNEKVAMLVRDIYGGSYRSLGLPGDIVAADFGRIATLRDVSVKTRSGEVHAGGYPIEKGDIDAQSSDLLTEQDLTRAILVMILNNIAQVAYMTATQHNVKHIFFTGGFLREGLMMRILTSGLRFWSQGDIQAAFLRHEAYFGALGALLHAREAEKNS